MADKINIVNLTSTLTEKGIGRRITPHTSNHDFYIGLSLAIASSFFIGSSFILKKKGLIKLSSQESSNHPKKGLRAAQGGHGYLKEWLWWSGFLTMGLGELCNFTAYGFVPATLVTPLGALSVLVSAVMAAYFLDEKLNTIGKIGCALTAIGSTVMVIHAPKEGEINSLQELLYKLLDVEFVVFVIITIASLLMLIYVLVPRYGNTNVLVYILICSILGSYTVMSCKGISLGIKEILNAKPTVPYVYTSIFVLVALTCIVIQINYLNKALDVFNTAIVTTVYYVLFSLFVMIASALLFKELMNVSFEDFVGCMCGFSTIICALCLIHFFKSDTDAQLKDFKNLYAMEKFTNTGKTKCTLTENGFARSSDIESNPDSVSKQACEPNVNQNGLFENLTKKPTNKQSDAKLNELNYRDNFNDLNIEKSSKNHFSLMSYLNENYKNLENKYLNRFKATPNFTNYNYNQLMTENDESETNIKNETNTIPRMKLIKSGVNNTKNYHYFEPLEEFEQTTNLIEKPSSALNLNSSDEMNPLSI